jgi:hypothetical protein
VLSAERDAEVFTIHTLYSQRQFNNMVVAEIKPKDQKELQRIVTDSPPGQEKQLAIKVRNQVSTRLICIIKEVRN